MKRIPGYIILNLVFLLSFCKNPSTQKVVSTDSIVNKIIAVDSNQLNQEKSPGFSKELIMGNVSFKVTCTDSGSLNKLTIIPSGIEQKDIISADVDGSITDAVIADINDDTFPEVYCFASSAGSGSYGKIYAYSSNKNKSMSPIHLPELTEDKKLSMGYMGHDVFKIEQRRLVRSFPLYKKGDPNALPTGGTRTVTYKLKPGEAGWVLVVDNVKDSK